MTDRELFEKALEALWTHVPHVYRDRGYPIITALRERLAQPEPGAWREVTYDQLMEEVRNRGYEIRNAKIIAPQPEQEPVCAHGVGKTKCDFCKQPEQEPVAWMYVNMDGECEQIEYLENEPLPDDPSITPLYVTPQRREWVGLTDGDIKALPQWFPSHETAAVLPLIRAVEAKLKEKNT